MTTLERIEPAEEGVRELAGMSLADNGSRRVVFGVDSGASRTVMREEDCGDYPVDPKFAATYMSACKQSLRTRGRRSLVCRNGDRLRAEVGPISKNLLAVAELCDTGHRVTFDNETGYEAVHKASGRSLRFDRVGNVFNMSFDILPYEALSFTRQGVYRP